MTPKTCTRTLQYLLAAVILGIASVHGTKEYEDNTDKIMKGVDLSHYHGLIDPVALNGGPRGLGGIVQATSDPSLDDRIFFGEVASHTKENCFILNLLPTADDKTLELLCKLFRNLDGSQLKHQLMGVRSAVVCFREGTLPAKLLQSIRGLDTIERDRTFQASEPKPEQASDSVAVNRLSYDNGMTPLNYNGQGVNVYIVDSGIDVGHPEFEGRASIGYSLFGNSIGADCSGHGTSVASCAGGKTCGVAPGVNLISVQVLDCQGSGSTSGMLSAIDWLKKNAKKPCVVNMSFVGGRSPSIDYALSQLVSSGVPVTIAAGNFNKDAILYSPNGQDSGAIAVGATDAGFKRAGFSNYGTSVDIFAPGTRVQVAEPGGGYGVESGTSFSAPYVAGVCAMILQKIPSCPPEQIEKIVEKIAIHGELQDLKGSPNIFLQAPYYIGSKSEYSKQNDVVVGMDADRVATYSNTIIAPTPFNTTATTTTATINTDIINAAVSFDYSQTMAFMLTVMIVLFFSH